MNTSRDTSVRRFRLPLPSLLAGLLATLLGASAAQAQVTINPFRIRHSLAPGETRNFDLRLNNPTQNPITVRISFEDFLPGPSGEILYVEAGLNPRGLADHVRVSPGIVTIPPRSEAKARMTVQLPATAHGDYYCVVAAVDTNAAARKLGYVTEVASVAIISALPAEKKQASLLGLTALPDLEAGWKAMATLQNDSSLRLFAEVYLDILDEQGDLAGRGRGRGYIYPDSTRTLKISMPPLPGGNYVLVARTDYGGDETLVAQIVVNLPTD